MSKRKLALLSSANLGLLAMQRQEARPVDTLDKVYTQLMLGDRHAHRIGDGERRAKERVAEQRQSNATLPDQEAAPTRQQLRRHTKLRERQALTKAKAVARHEKVKGGSGGIKELTDIETVLGS